MGEDDPLSTSSTQSEAWRRRAIPPMEEVSTGIWSIPVPARGNPIRFTYAYLITAAEESILVDPGALSAEGTEALDNAFRSIAFSPEKLTGILVTHFHFDHWEGADRLAARTGAWIALGEPELAWIEGLTEADIGLEAATRRFRRWGVPEGEAEVLAAIEDYGHTLGHRPPDLRLVHGQHLPLDDIELQVLHTPGHTPGHICLVACQRDLLFSGDHLLPGISPHIALNPFGSPDPLGQYLDSLEMTREFASAEVLPAHEYRFTGVRRRISELRADVRERAAEVQQIVDRSPTASVWDVAQRLSWSRPWSAFGPQSRSMAVGETAAYLANLSVGGPAGN